MRSQMLRIYLLTIAVLIACAPDALADGPPAWLTQAATVPTPTYEIKDVPAVVLRNEEAVSITADGTVIRTVRRAVRVLTNEGRGEAEAAIHYTADSETVREFTAWLVPAGGQVRTFGKKEVIDIAASDNELYSDSRARIVSAEKLSSVGDVFGYEAIVEQKSIFSQFQFLFQGSLPVLGSRFSLTLPSGWRAESVTFNRIKVEPVVSGTNYVWELSGLQPIKPEAGSPSWASLSPRLAVSFFPTAPTATGVRTFGNWNEVARWMAEIEDPQMVIDDALAAKTKEITASARTELDKIKAVAAYVQQLRYVAIAVGTGKGGGYIPHKATDVFAKSYGDCKDKANLMRAMLFVLNIPAYMVSITADDRDFVQAEWPSPHQFNHCIIAVKVGDETAAHSVIKHPRLGRLLIFDATDPYTQVGDLPEDEQGSYALIDHKETDALIRIPVMPAEMNRLERSLEVTLDDTGAINGMVTEQTVGQAAADERARLRRSSAADYNQIIEKWIGRGAPGAKAIKITPEDKAGEGRFSLAVDFSARTYAQIMQDHLMVFRPAIIGRLERLGFTEGKRQNPFKLDAADYTETVKIKLPAGFVVDEMPDAAKLETPFGQYNATYRVEGDTLLFSRSLKLARATIPPDKYETVRDFFGRIHSAEQSPVVLLKK